MFKSLESLVSNHIKKTNFAKSFYKTYKPYL